jgi:hypothetical protein
VQKDQNVSRLVSASDVIIYLLLIGPVTGSSGKDDCHVVRVRVWDTDDSRRYSPVFSDVTWLEIIFSIAYLLQYYCFGQNYEAKNARKCALQLPSLGFELWLHFKFAYALFFSVLLSVLCIPIR